MWSSRHAVGLAETQSRLETLVSIRSSTGFTQAEQAEYRELSVVEQAFLGLLHPYKAR